MKKLKTLAAILLPALLCSPLMAQEGMTLSANLKSGSSIFRTNDSKAEIVLRAITIDQNEIIIVMNCESDDSERQSLLAYLYFDVPFDIYKSGEGAIKSRSFESAAEFTGDRYPDASYAKFITTDIVDSAVSLLTQDPLEFFFDSDIGQIQLVISNDAIDEAMNNNLKDFATTCVKYGH